MEKIEKSCYVRERKKKHIENDSTKIECDFWVSISG